MRNLVVTVMPLSSIFAVVNAKSIVDFPVDIRKANTLRISTETCSECMTLERFYADNPIGFVLFYERALSGMNSYKQSIIEAFDQACQSFRYSHVACGRVDMINDREYAMRYIDPNTAPAHIVVKNGEPQMAQKKHVDRLMKDPSSPDNLIWHVNDLIKPSISEISKEAYDFSSLQKMIAKSTVVIVGYAGKDAALATAFRAAAQRLVWKGIVPKYHEEAKSEKKREKARIVYIAARDITYPSGSPKSEQGQIGVFLRSSPIELEKARKVTKDFEETEKEIENAVNYALRMLEESKEKKVGGKKQTAVEKTTEL